MIPAGRFSLFPMTPGPVGAIAAVRRELRDGGLRAELPSTLPAPGAELFIQAGAIVAERALSDAGNCATVEVILRRASDQAAAAHR
jgi:hypothetical protein